MYFNPEEVEDVGGFEVIPAGWYRVMVEGVEVKSTRNGDGTYCGVKMHVVEGPHAKRTLFSNFNIEHKNADAQRIGRGQFKRFLAAIGVTTGFDMANVHNVVVNKLLYVRVQIGKHYQTGEPANDVKDWGVEPGKAQVQAAPKTASKPVDDLDNVPF